MTEEQALRIVCVSIFLGVFVVVREKLRVGWWKRVCEKSRQKSLARLNRTYSKYPSGSAD